MGFPSLTTKFHLPVWLLYGVAYICQFLTVLTGKKFKLTPFTVKMMTIHRYFSLENATKDLQYKPLKTFDEAWPETIEWFKIHWLPKWKQEGSKDL
mmetsp:Transcript_6179/g.18292  ORF Transcript_6179/g.18292 Transcript_6179/m.18292 type:complete len:96 (+) Transcript_6179:1-288(+)